MNYNFDLGTHTRAITTTSPQAQLWFDSGLNWCFSFNHEEGVSCFKKALEHDPSYAMAWWGIAYAAGRDRIYAQPRHPYTQALLSAAPKPDPAGGRSRIVLPGEVPSPVNPPPGCPFHPRCHLTRRCAQQADAAQTVPVTVAGQSIRVMCRCVEETPRLVPAPDAPDHTAACFFQDQPAPAAAKA